MKILFSDYRVTNKLHVKKINVRGMEDEVHVLRLPAVDNRRYVAEMMSDDIDVRATAGFDALVKAIRNEDGTAATTVEEMKLIDVDLLKELIRIYQEVNASGATGDLGNG